MDATNTLFTQCRRGDGHSHRCRCGGLTVSSTVSATRANCLRVAHGQGATMMPNFDLLMASGVSFAAIVLSYLVWRFGMAEAISFAILSGGFSAILDFSLSVRCGKLCVSGAIPALGIRLHLFRLDRHVWNVLADCRGYYLSPRRRHVDTARLLMAGACASGCNPSSAPARPRLAG
jgi:hypothetical protein